ncbi:MAG TPA: hypothetical protein VJR02_26155 [Pyrinomonadaceae bacterium]|nr:hypothetical protein [Pyrinomonadaceae bacterium]
MRRITTFVTLVILAMAVFSGAIDNKNKTLAADYTCRNGTTCPGQAECSGQYFSKTGCAITCYRETGVPGEISINGSANCSPPSTGGGSGGSGGGGAPGGGGYGGGYCYDNWFWDSNCNQDPSNPYDPDAPWIN